jgi:hypothetical protein
MGILSYCVGRDWHVSRERGDALTFTMDRTNMMVPLKKSYLISYQRWGSQTATAKKKVANSNLEGEYAPVSACHGIHRRGHKSLLRLRPHMSDPHTATNWLPAKSWQHFLAGGYAHLTRHHGSY